MRASFVNVKWTLEAQLEQETPRGTDQAMDLIRLLAKEIGPRPPCSQAEARAAQELRDWCQDHGIEARLEPFAGYRSGGEQVGALVAIGLAAGLLQRRRPMLGRALTGGALVLGVLEADLRHTPLSDLLSRKPSHNLIASIPAAGEERTRICLCGHMDSTRSGLIFHPSLIGWLAAAIKIPGASLLALAGASVLGRRRIGRILRRAGMAGLAVTVALTLERELRGTDVPGAGDNASGTAVALTLAAEIAATPLEHTRVDVLITGCEEAWMLGSRAYMRGLKRGAAASGATPPIFLNFDTVGGNVPLTYILSEGLMPRPASQRLIGLCKRIATQRPELDLRPAKGTAGLPTDATPALAHGYEAITILAQSGEHVIPNYHWPTDTYENVEPATVERALEVGRELIRALNTESLAQPRFAD